MICQYIRKTFLLLVLAIPVTGLSAETTTIELNQKEERNDPLYKYEDLSTYKYNLSTIVEAKEMGQNVLDDFIVDPTDQAFRNPKCQTGRSLEKDDNGKDFIKFWANYDYSRKSHSLPERMVNPETSGVGSASFGMFQILARSETQDNNSVWVTGFFRSIKIPRDEFPLQEGYSKGEIMKYSENNFFINDRTYSNGVLTMHIESAMQGEKTCETIHIWTDPELTYPTKMHFKKSVIIPKDKECSKAALAQETTCRLIIN